MFVHIPFSLQASSKVVKLEKTCSDNQHVFIHVAFDTFGFVASEVVDLLHRVQKSLCITILCLLDPEMLCLPGLVLSSKKV